MIIYDPKITGSFEVNGSSLSSLESIDNVSGSVVDLTAASASLSTRVSDQESFSSSLDATFATDTQVSTAVSSLNNATASYALITEISGSTTSLSSSLASELLKNTTDTLTGDLTVTGTMTAQEFHTEFVSASIIYQSGSTKFGDTSDDIHNFTGSLQVSGSATFTNTVQIGDSSVTNFSLGANSSDFELSAKKNGTDAISMVFKTQASGGALSEAMRIDSSGHVGIGITPNVNSTVVNVIQLGKGMTLLGNANDDRATMAANLYLDTGTAFRYVMDGLAGRFSIEDGNMIWGTAGSGTEGTVATVDTKMTLLNNGSLGIGTNSPNAKLEVASGQAKTVTSGVEFARFGTSNEASNYATLNCEMKGGATAADRKWIFQTIESGVANAGSIIFQPDGGNVGIGATPTSTLHLENSDSETILTLEKNTVTAGTTIGTLRFVNSGATNTYASVAGGRNSDGDGMLTLKGGGSSGLHILESGQMRTLNRDFAKESYYGYSSGYRAIVLGSTGTNTSTNSTTVAINYDPIGNAYSGFSGDGREVLFRRGVQFVTPNSDDNSMFLYNLVLKDGNVGIGTNSPDEKLDVENGNIRIKSNSDGNTGVLRMYDAAGTESGQIYPSAGDLRFYTPNDIIMSPTGKVGIGTTSPTGKLSVETNGNHLHLRANTATAGKYWNFDITSDNQLYIVNNGGTGIQVLDNGKVGIGGTPEQKLHVEGIGIFDGGASSDILQIRNDNGSGVFGMTPNLFALDLASTSNFRIRQGSTVPLYLKSDGNLGIGTTNPFAPLQVNGTHSTLNAHFGQGTNNSNGVFGGISLGYSESNALYRKVGIVAQAKGDNSARQDLHFLVDIASDQNSAGIADSKMMIAHDTGYVGIATAAPAAPLHVHGNIQSKEGIISPTFYVARNYGSTSGNFAGYDDITEGDVIDIKDHSIGSLNSFAHGQTDPIINGSSDSIDWNYFRLLFRYTNNSATYTNYTVGFKVARYYYNTGWTENSAEFSGNGMDGARGPRWAVSPWTTTGGTDVPGIGLKYFNNNDHTQTIRVHAIYIQYKS